eukprot:UN25872
MFYIEFQNEHVLYSIWGRYEGSNLSNRYRVFAFGISNHKIQSFSVTFLRHVYFYNPSWLSKLSKI